MLTFDKIHINRVIKVHVIIQGIRVHANMGLLGSVVLVSAEQRAKGDLSAPTETSAPNALTS